MTGKRFVLIWPLVSGVPAQDQRGSGCSVFQSSQVTTDAGRGFSPDLLVANECQMTRGTWGFALKHLVRSPFVVRDLTSRFGCFRFSSHVDAISTRLNETSVG